MLAVYGRSPEVRRRATEFLRNRPAAEYLDLLVSLMIEPLRYEVKPVGGPGSPGVLFVEGQQFNVARFYAPPPPPNVTPQPGDLIVYDAYGMPTIIRDLGQVVPRRGVPGSKTLAYDTMAVARFSATEMMLQAEKGAAQAESQLKGDVAQIRAINDGRRRFNELVMAVARYASGIDPGDDPRDWRKAAEGEKYTETTNKPTVPQTVPLDYQPAFAQLTFMTRIVKDS